MRIACWMAVVALSLPLGVACSQVAESKAPQLEGQELASALADEGIFLLDVREPSELEELGTVEGYVNIPIDQLADRLDELPRDQRILTA